MENNVVPHRKPVALPHLSPSRVDKYLRCPEQYRLHYVEGLRPRKTAASLVFGKAIHRALSEFFRKKSNAVEAFAKAWEAAREQDLRYAGRESWETLDARGRALLAKFLLEELPRLSCCEASEESFELAVSNLPVPFIGILDLMACVDGVSTIIDFKTAGKAYQGYEGDMSDQLTAYQIAKPQVQQSALCVFVKTKESRIEWFFTRRTPEDRTAYLSKVEHIGNQILNGHFYKRPGPWCSYCDFLPVCLGDQQQVEATLMKDAA